MTTHAAFVGFIVLVVLVAVGKITAVSTAATIPLTILVCEFLFSGILGIVTLAAESNADAAWLKLAAVAVAFALSTLVSRSTLSGRGVGGYLAMLALLFSGVFAALAKMPPPSEQGNAGQSVVLFLGIFPIVNAVFDYLSYGVTIWLVRSGLRQRILSTLVFWFLDAVFAGTIFLALSAVLVGIVAALNRVSGGAMFDVGMVLTGLETTPEQYWWVFGMIFSTLVPTLVHLGIVALSMITWVPPQIRMPIEAGIAGRAESGLRFQLAALATTTVHTLYALTLTWGLYELGRWLWSHKGPVLYWYLDRIEWWAGVLGAI